MATIIRVGGGAGKAEGKNPAVSTLAEEKILLITENGIPTEYYIAKHGYEPELNNNRTLLVRKDVSQNGQWDAGGVNAYAGSDIDLWMNGDFYNCLSSGVRDLIGATTFYYTPGNGNFTVTTLQRAVFALSMNEYGLSDAGTKLEGSPLPIASVLKVARLNGSAVVHWSRTPHIGGNTSAYYVNASGAIGGSVYAVTTAYGYRPAFTIPSAAKVVGPDNYGRYSLEAETASEVYGIARDITASSPEWVRTDAAMTFSATASIGTVAGASDFDNIYPWSEMQRVTLDTGDVMVRIPKFYYGRYRNGNIERIQISGRADVGLTLHPAFFHGGVEADGIYVGAYKMGTGDCSKSGVAPVTGYNRAGMRMSARAKGTGWSLIDISTLSAIQMLYLVEFANNNSQQMIGRGYVDGSSSINTGTCDTVPNLTGRPAGTDGKTDVVYRGIEGIWGNVWEWVDGFVMVNGAYYVCNNPAHYADSTTNHTGMANSEQLNAYYSGSYIIKTSMDSANSHIMTPNTAGASETTNYCDAVWGASGTMLYTHGGDWGGGTKVGIFASAINEPSSAARAHIGSRLIYIPQGGKQ